MRFFWLTVGLPTVFFLSSCDSPSEGTKSEVANATSDYSPWHDIPDAEYVGAASCKECHQDAFHDWMQSDHHKAMSPANEETVLGDFDDAEFEHYGRKTRFFRKGEEYWVNAELEDGSRADLKVDYTFGHYPLQQYLIPFPGGRYQALQVCWDSRPKEEGGQRWYHLYPNEEIPPSDVLHWTRRHFNWNYMCADCHSTDLKKNYNLSTDSYATTWSEMNVSCEACHGPASKHLEWAAAYQDPDSTANGGSELVNYMKSKGLVVTLKEPTEGAWLRDPDTGQPKRSVPLASNVQVDTCARCHSHRQLMESNFEAGHPFHETHSPSILTDQLYHHDGQVDEEVYVYGSFVQSKMYHSGVRCTDCHHPHTMKPLVNGNALCVRCHSPEKYDSETHHFHPPGSTGASCVECHMPTKNYMVVDARRDHSLRVPRPDLAHKTNSPDACTQCHQDQTTEWATAAFKEWWGAGPRNAHYGEILAAARLGEPGSMDALIALANDLERPGIVRATAVEAISQQAPSQASLGAITQRLNDPDPGVRKEALRGLIPLPANQRLQVAGHLLIDPVRSVRAEAARALAVAFSNLSEQQQEDFDRAAQEFRKMQEAIADRAAGHMGLALFLTDLGKEDEAIEAYRRAAKIEPEYIPARINLAELLYQQNRPREAESEFRAAADAAALDENEGLARDALARFLIRMKRYDEGIEELRSATELLPRHAQTQYFYGVALNSQKQFEKALPYLEKAHELDPYNLEYLIGLATICRDAGEREKAIHFTKKALQLQPQNPQLQKLYQSL